MCVLLRVAPLPFSFLRVSSMRFVLSVRPVIWVKPQPQPITPPLPTRPPELMALQQPLSPPWPTLPSRPGILLFIHYLMVFLFKIVISNSYGTDPYLGHSIGPVPTYGVTNSVELQSVNKLVGFFYKVSFCAHIINRIFLLFSCILRLRCTEVVTTGSHPIESARK